MPELPEVETVRRDLRKSVVGRTIQSVEIGRDDILCECAPDDFVGILPGRVITAVERIGKNLILRLSGGPALVVHLGMTGQFYTLARGEPRPDHVHVVLELSGDLMLVYRDTRRFGHLELVNIFLRALKRASITVKYSEGFHPNPKISFDDPLPVGIESQQERFVLTVPDYVRPQMIARQLNEQLPAGLSVHDCRPAPLKSKGPVDRHQTYRITLAGQQFDPEKLDEFIRRSEARLRWTNRKGKLKNIDLKSMVEKIDLINFACVEMTLATGQGKTVRPGQVLRYIFDLTEQQIKLAKIVKLATTPA